VPDGGRTQHFVSASLSQGIVVEEGADTPVTIVALSDDWIFST
jgi:hypothetical protein